MRTAPFFVEGIGGMKVVGVDPLPGSTICLHGGPGGNCLSLYPFFPPERLAGDWFFADLPNHGRSESTGGDFRPATCIERLERFAATLQGPLACGRAVLGLQRGPPLGKRTSFPVLGLHQHFRCAGSSGHHRASGTCHRHHASGAAGTNGAGVAGDGKGP